MFRRKNKIRLLRVVRLPMPLAKMSGENGMHSLHGSNFVVDHLRPAVKAAGVHIEDGQRFGLHNLRHSLSTWLVNKAKVEPKTVQGILRHSKIQTMLDLYTPEDSDETRAAQGEFLTAVGMTAMVQ